MPELNENRGPTRREQALRRAAETGTWRYRNFVLQSAVLCLALGLAAAVSAVLSGLWFAWPAAASWVAVGVLAWRHWRALRAAGGEISAQLRAKRALAGLGLFLAGAAFMVVGALLR